MAKRKKVGRPSKYRPKFCQKIIGFFDREPYEDIKLPHYKNGELKWNDIKRMPNKLPTLAEFAKHIKVGYSNVFEWQNPKSKVFHPEFQEAFIQAKGLQKNFLIQNGLQGLYNPLFAKFVAINITDMVDKQEHEHSGNLQVQVINKIPRQNGYSS